MVTSMPAPPLRRARQAAVQRQSEPPAFALIRNVGTGRNAGAEWLSWMQSWQSWARRFAQSVGFVRFQSSIASQTCGGCRLLIEEQQADGTWAESEDGTWANLFAMYANTDDDAAQLVRLHAYRYSTDGEGFIVVYPGPNGETCYGVFNVECVDIKGDTATVKRIPNGKVADGTAFTVPKEACTRFWFPNPDWPLLATSPLAASIDDVKRWVSLARYAQRTADSQLAMGGMLWAPQGPFEVETDDSDEDDAGDIATPVNRQEEAYAQAARQRFGDSDDVSVIAPYMVHWDKDEGKPEWIKLGDGLDQSGIEHRHEALEDFARGGDAPSSLIVGGGPNADSNHWTEWLVSAKFFDAAIKPLMDRIAHLDLTRTFLADVARAMGRPMRAASGAPIRVGYDAEDVIVKADQSADSRELYKLGLLHDEAVLDANNFDVAQRATDADIERLVYVTSAGKMGQPDGAPIGAENVVQTPPTPPTPVAAASANGHGETIDVAALLAVVLNGAD